MSTHIQDIETQWADTRSIACQSPTWWLAAIADEPPKPAETPAIPAEIEPDGSESYFPDAADPAEWDSSAENEFYWQQIGDSEFAYLTAPRNYPDPCTWCGGRSTHNPTCDELRGSWEVAMPFGKWKGKPLSQVPADYLAWLVGNSDSLDTELREAIQWRLSV